MSRSLERGLIVRTLLLLAVVVVGSMLVAVAGVWFAQQAVPPEVLKANNEVCGNYLQTVGTIYAVLLAFVVYVVWQQQNEAWRLIERQADELTDVLRIARLLGEPAGSDVQNAARAYVQEVIELEWQLMACKRSSPRAAELLNQIWIALTSLEPKTPREETLYAEAITRFNDFSDARSDLLQNSRLRMPPTLWILLLTGALSLIGSMSLFSLEAFWCLALMTASLAGAISFVLFLIYDLDHAFSGTWQVRPEPLKLLLEHLKDA